MRKINISFKKLSFKTLTNNLQKGIVCHFDFYDAEIFSNYNFALQIYAILKKMTTVLQEKLHTNII
jgi:hypothetical protein